MKKQKPFGILFALYLTAILLVVWWLLNHHKNQPTPIHPRGVIGVGISTSTSIIK